jgi:plasmid stabilization system protein ParE
MQIKRSRKFLNQLLNILEYIAQDKLSASKKFKKELDLEIDSLTNFPFKYRKSRYFDDENIRYMIFKGYTIIYRINKEKDYIEIVRIFKRNQPL